MKTLKTDPNASFDKIHSFSAEEILPQVTWGTSPEMVTHVDDSIPDVKEDNKTLMSALDYMGLKPEQKLKTLNLIKFSWFLQTRIEFEHFKNFVAIKFQKIKNNSIQFRTCKKTS